MKISHSKCSSLQCPPWTRTLLWIIVPSLSLFLNSCEIGNIIRREASPGFGSQTAADPILLLPVVDQSGTIDPDAFVHAFRMTLRDYQESYRFALAPAVPLDSPGQDYSTVVIEAIDVFEQKQGLDGLAGIREPVLLERPGVLGDRYFAVTVVRQHSVHKESREEYDSDASGWREVSYVTRVFRGDFFVFAPDRTGPVFFVRYERESEESDADAAGDDESPGQVCVDAFGNCLFNLAVQVVSGGRADSQYDDDLARFMKAVALELP